MDVNEFVVATGAAGGVAYVAKSLFGPTLNQMGTDLNKVYEVGRDKLIEKAAKKVLDPNDGAKPNLRVARDVIWNGAVTEDEVCAEYFGGVLASSRSSDGKDDSALIYVDCIKALSSKQLHLHFVIYNSLHKMLIENGGKINPGLSDEISAKKVWFSFNEVYKWDLNPSINLNVLHRQGLVSAYAVDNHSVDGKYLPYFNATPTTFGVLLYAAALNNLNSWKDFGSKDFRSVDIDIPVPKLFTPSLEELCVLVGMPKPAPSVVI